MGDFQLITSGFVAIGICALICWIWYKKEVEKEKNEQPGNN